MNRHKTRIISRLVALSLVCALTLPNPAFALRQTGLEEAEGEGKPKAQLVAALTSPSVSTPLPSPVPTSLAPVSPAAGVEEKKLLSKLLDRYQDSTRGKTGGGELERVDLEYQLLFRSNHWEVVHLLNEWLAAGKIGRYGAYSSEVGVPLALVFLKIAAPNNSASLLKKAWQATLALPTTKSTRSEIYRIEKAVMELWEAARSNERPAAGLEERSWPGWIKPYQAVQLSAILFHALTEVRAEIPLSKLDRSSLEIICRGALSWLEKGALQEAEKKVETFSLDQARHFFNNVPDILGISQEMPSFEVRVFWLQGLIQTLDRVWKRFPFGAGRQDQISFLIVESASPQSSRSAREALPFINAQLSSEEQRGIASRLLEMLLAPSSPAAGLEESQALWTRLEEQWAGFRSRSTNDPMSWVVIGEEVARKFPGLPVFAGLEQHVVIARGDSMETALYLAEQKDVSSVHLFAGLEEARRLTVALNSLHINSIVHSLQDFQRLLPEILVSLGISKEATSAGLEEFSRQLKEFGEAA